MCLKFCQNLTAIVSTLKILGKTAPTNLAFNKIAVDFILAEIDVPGY